MIAKANLETKRKALAERASKLAFEKIACFERIDAIGRSLEQIDLLSKVMDVTLEDIEKDEAAKTLVAEQMQLLSSRNLYLEGQLEKMMEASKEDGDGKDN